MNLNNLKELKQNEKLQYFCDVLYWFYDTNFISEELESKVFALFDDILCILSEVEKK